MKQEGRIFDLEQRTLEFSKRIVRMTKALPKDDSNRHFGNQCLRSGTSVGANYREANDALGDKDFIHRMKISRKEAKETTYWIDLIIEYNPHLEERMQPLKQECIELTKILSTIIKNKSKKNKNK